MVSEITNSLIIELRQGKGFYFAPNFKEWDGAYFFWVVHPSVCHAFLVSYISQSLFEVRP